MEHTEGLGRAAEVWIDGALLTVCDGISPRGRRTPPGPLEGVKFQYTNDEAFTWDLAKRRNKTKNVSLEPLTGWSYFGYGRVEQIMPVVIHFGLLRLEDATWTTDETLVGQYVGVPINRLELVPAEEEEL